MNATPPSFLFKFRFQTTASVLLSLLLSASLSGCLNDFDNTPTAGGDTATIIDEEVHNTIDPVDDVDVAPDAAIEKTCKRGCDDNDYCFDGDCYTPPMLAMGSSHTCALTDATIKCWGDNRIGQLGTNDTKTNPQTHTPTAVNISEPPVSVYAGNLQTCAITKKDNNAYEVFCWGAHSALKQLDNNNYAFDPAPKKLPTIGDIEAQVAPPVQLALSNTHSCARLRSNDGRLRCWGNNIYGQLGNGTSTVSRTPVTVKLQNETLKAASQVITGSDFTCSLHPQYDAVYCWGDNSMGQLGHRLQTGNWAATPQQIPTLTKVATIESGTRHACAILKDTTLRCWGANSNGQLGTGDKDSSFEPVAPTVQLLGVKQIALGHGFTCALLNTGKIYCAGTNASGQLGIDPHESQGSNTFVLNPNFSNVHQIKVGSNHLCAVHDNNLLSCWGLNENAQMGNSQTESTHIPTLINLY